MTVSRFKNVVAVLPVADHAGALAWYTNWIGRGPDVEPMEGVAEWQLAEHAWIQVGQDEENAGNGSVIVGVDDLDELVADLGKVGVTCGEIQDYDFIKLSELADPEGNTVNFVWENPNHAG